MENDCRVGRWSENFPPDSAKSKQIMEIEGFSLFEWTDGANAVYGNHKHSDGACFGRKIRNFFDRRKASKSESEL